MASLHPSRRLPFNPATLLADAERAIKPSDVTATAAAWVKPVTAIPPHQPIPTAGCPQSWGVFAGSSSQKTSSSSLSRWRGAKGKAFRYTKPPRIHFPEDEIRKAFFKAHPFEWTRPKLLSETAPGAKASELDYSHGILGRPLPNQSEGSSPLHPAALNIDAEHVVYYTLYLCSNSGGGLSHKAAYTRALLEFYAIRQQQGRLQHQMTKKKTADVSGKRQHLPASTFISTLPYTERFITLEDEALKRHHEVAAAERAASFSSTSKA